MKSRARQAVQKLSPYVCARDLFKDARILLDANENSFGSALSYPGFSLNRYPDPDCTLLREQLADYCEARLEQVLVGNGSDEIVSLALNAFAEKGDNIVTLQPGYTMYGVCAAIAGVEARGVRLSSEFKPDLQQILASCDASTRMLFLSSPEAAAGTPLEESKIRAILEEFEGMVFLDEAYYEFGGKSSISLAREYDNLIVSRTLSKAWGLAGLRIGYCVSSEENTAALRKIKPPYNVGTLNQYLATTAVACGREAMLENVWKIMEERQRLSGQLKKLGLEAFPGKANFVLARLPKKFDSKRVQALLAKKSIAVRERSSQPMLENCLRVTVGTPAENEELLHELKKILAGRS